jgi:integrase
MTPKRPAPSAVGPWRLRVARGPHKEHADRWYWRAGRFRGGAEETLWTGWATREEAERIVGGMLSTGQKKAAPSAGIATVGDLVDYWLGAQEDRADLRPRSIETMRAACKALVRGLGSVRIERVTTATLETYRDGRLRAGDAIAVERADQKRGRLPRVQRMAPETVARELRMLGQAWRWAYEGGHVANVAPPRVRLNVRPVVDRYTPTLGEVSRVLSRLSSWPAVAVRLLASTGCRLGEIAGLRWRDVDTERGEIRVSGKTGPRTIPLGRAFLASLPRPLIAIPDALVLGVSPSSALTSLRRYLAEAIGAENEERRKRGESPMPLWTAHALRRLAVDRLYRAGVDVATAASILGHSPDVALKHYRRASDGDRRAAVDLARLGYLPDAEGAEVIEIGKG